MSAKRLKGRYTATDDFSYELVGEVRYLDPSNGELYNNLNSTHRANSGFREVGPGLWVNGEWVFVVDSDADAPPQHTPTEQPMPTGYVISSANGVPTVLHRTQKSAEAEALRLAHGNTGKEFTVFPVYYGKAVAKAHAPKPVAQLEKL